MTRGEPDHGVAGFTTLPPFITVILVVLYQGTYRCTKMTFVVLVHSF
jgi:hypothetical protein